MFPICVSTLPVFRLTGPPPTVAVAVGSEIVDGGDAVEVVPSSPESWRARRCRKKPEEVAAV